LSHRPEREATDVSRSCAERSSLGKLAGVTQQQIAKLEDPDENPTLQTIEKVARALGLSVNIELAADPVSMMSV
jgi:predicted transcriptional regulator